MGTKSVRGYRRETTGRLRSCRWQQWCNLSATNTNSTAGADPSNFPRNNSAVLQQFSLFYAGRIAEQFGAFAQWTYDGIAHHSSIDNVDLRYANHLKREGTDLTYGLTLNNNPTVSDIYNTTPPGASPLPPQV